MHAFNGKVPRPTGICISVGCIITLRYGTAQQRPQSGAVPPCHGLLTRIIAPEALMTLLDLTLRDLSHDHCLGWEFVFL